MDSLNKLREVTASRDFMSVYNTLRRIIIQTPTLIAVTAEIEKLQNQIALSKNSDGTWNSDRRLRLEGFLGIGRPGCGKTFAVETALSMLTPVTVNGVTKTQIEPKIISVSAPSHGTATALAREIISKSGAPMVRDPGIDDAVPKLLGALKKREYTLIHIDELQRCLDAKRHAPKALVRESALIWRMIISVLDMPEWPTPLAITGLPSILDSFTVLDPTPEAKTIRSEAKRRLNLFRFPDLSIASDSELIAGIIDGYCKEAGVENNLKSSDEVGGRLIHASERAWGTALTFAQKAVALASARPRGKLNLKDFSATYHFTTAAPNSANVFAANDWPSIDVSVIAPTSRREVINQRSLGPEEV